MLGGLGRFTMSTGRWAVPHHLRHTERSSLGPQLASPQATVSFAIRAKLVQKIGGWDRQSNTLTTKPHHLFSFSLFSFFTLHTTTTSLDTTTSSLHTTTSSLHTTTKIDDQKSSTSIHDLIPSHHNQHHHQKSTNINHQKSSTSIHDQKYVPVVNDKYPCTLC